MPENNIFSKYKKKGIVKVSFVRKAHHSLLDKIKTMSKSEGAENAATAAGAVSTSSTLAVFLGASGLFVTAAAGAPASIGLAIISMFLIAKNLYTNREAAHREIQDYVWSYIDSKVPKQLNEDIADKVGGAALSLISDGKSQQLLAESKLKSAEKAFDAFYLEYLRYGEVLSTIPKNGNQEAKKRTEELEKLRSNSLDAAFGQNGAVSQYLRTLNHHANYIQAYMIVGQLAQKNYSPLEDIAEAEKGEGIKRTREKLGDFSEAVFGTRDIISEFKVPDVSRYRRVKHSAKNRIQAINKSAKLKRGKHGANATLSTADAVCGGGAALLEGIAYTSVVIGIGAVGIIKAAYGAFSNRESAHNTLQPHVWSYIDAEPPLGLEEATGKKIAGAAMVLIQDYNARQKTANEKFLSAQRIFNAFWSNYLKLNHEIYILSTRSEQEMKAMSGARIVAIRKLDRRKQLLDSAFAKQGAAAEFMRRLNHLANYRQAAIIIGKVAQKNFRQLIPDFGKEIKDVQAVRDQLDKISNRIQKDDETYETILKMPILEVTASQQGLPSNWQDKSPQSKRITKINQSN